MGLDPFDVVRVSHVLAAATALGALAALPVLRTGVHGAGDSRFAEHGLALMARLERRLLAPAAVATLVLGVAMVEGSWARYSFTGAGWLHVGAGAWTLLAGALVALARVRGGLEARAAEGATGGEPVRDLWRKWWAAWGVATGAIVGAVVAMVARSGI